ncbi:anti-sigma factor [uncultured Tateyamaria sp.]|uniref:anti-sigma factor n=1 Tax=uncultured Tateyamaria sp. TaxID=455651 RepID=UPI002603779F|nr:anti-sigma factor [uncultured Tateyamaria sp.]
MTEATAHDEDRALAGEYVMGLLSFDERRSVEARLRQEPAFVEEVGAWEAYFAGLNEDYGTVHPSRQSKARIDARLFAAPKRKSRWWVPISLVTAVLAMAVIIGFFVPNLGNAPHLAAQLGSDESNYSFSVSVGDEGDVLDIALTAGDVVPDRTFELWLIPADGTPRSLGTFNQSERLSTATIQEGALLAVSLEPVGGSQTGAPTGPVLATGVLDDA